MAQKKEEPVEVLSAVVHGDPDLPGTLALGHVDFPEWAFVVVVVRPGIAASFAVWPRAAVFSEKWEDGTFVANVGALVIPHDPPEVTARLLRRVPIGEIVRVAVERWRASGELLANHLVVGRERRGWLDALNARPGRRGRSDHDYARVAALYVEHLGSRTPTKDLAEELGYDTSTITSLIYEARRRGLLTRTAQGRAGGELTDKAIRLLEGTDDGEH